MAATRAGQLIGRIFNPLGTKSFGTHMKHQGGGNGALPVSQE